MIDICLAVALLGALWAAGIGLVLLALVRLRRRIDRLDLDALWAAGIGLVLLALVRLRRRIDRLDLDARIDRELARILDDEASR